MIITVGRHTDCRAGLNRILTDDEHILRMNVDAKSWRARKVDRALVGNSLLINWGVAHEPQPGYNYGTVLSNRIGCLWPAYLRCIHPPEVLQQFTNKLLFFQKCHGYDIPIPEWRTSHPEDDDQLWVARTLLSATNGNGIEIGTCDQISRAQLYTKYIPNRAEYRAHFYSRGAELQEYVIAKKRTPIGANVSTDQIRNTANGWRYAYRGDLPSGTRKQRIEELLSRFCASDDRLRFGGLDIIWDRDSRRALALEYNSAPGINNTIAQEHYRRAFDDIKRNG